MIWGSCSARLVTGTKTSLYLCLSRELFHVRQGRSRDIFASTVLTKELEIRADSEDSRVSVGSVATVKA